MKEILHEFPRQTPTHIKLDERSHVQKPLLEQLGWTPPRRGPVVVGVNTPGVVRPTQFLPWQAINSLVLWRESPT